MSTMSTAEFQEVTKYPANIFSWIDLTTPDQDGSKKFYTQLFGWTYEDMPSMEGMIYSQFQLHGKNVAGCGPMQPEQVAQGMPAYWASYVNVESADDTVANAQSAGGTIIMPPMDVFESGRMAVIQDPTGAIVGLWQPKSHIGASVVNIANAWVWNEVMTRDPEQAVEFYNKVFGWTSQSDDDTSGGDPYIMFSSKEGRAAAGLFQMTPEMEGMPPNWTMYINVDDVDATAEKAQTLGGKILNGPIDTGAGRIYVIQDPQGAIFNAIKATYVDAPPQG